MVGLQKDEGQSAEQQVPVLIQEDGSSVTKDPVEGHSAKSRESVILVGKN